MKFVLRALMHWAAICGGLTVVFGGLVLWWHLIGWAYGRFGELGLLVAIFGTLAIIPAIVGAANE